MTPKGRNEAMRKQKNRPILAGVAILCALAFGRDAEAARPKKSTLVPSKGKGALEDVHDSGLQMKGRAERTIALRTVNFEDNFKTFGKLMRVVDGAVLIGHPVSGDLDALSKAMNARVVKSPQEIRRDTIYDGRLYRSYVIGKSKALALDMIRRRLGSEVTLDLHRDNLGRLFVVNIHDK
jgi:hypothetical protein